MGSNFEFLKNNKQYESFGNACLEAENSLAVSPAVTAITARRALELAVKWVYSSDSYLKLPYQDNLSSLIHEYTFRDIIDPKLFHMIKYIVSLGNMTVHTNSKISREKAVLSLHNLHEFVSWIDYCYSDKYTESKFDEKILQTGDEKKVRPKELKDLYERLSSKDRKLEDAIKENKDLREKLTSKREKNIRDHTFKVDEITEFETRKQYIDLDLMSAGWEFNRDIEIEFPVSGMPNSSGTGAADYVLLGNNGRPIAVVEAKKTSVDPKKGKRQAELYANCIEKKYEQRPLIFYTNGFETYIWDDAKETGYPERKVSGFYTKDEIQLLIDRRTTRKSLSKIQINDDITNRYYQKEAITAVCEAIKNKQRKALLVMATGSGKTRVAISIVDVLTRHNFVKNILFLTDRTALVKQAKGNFNNLLPNLSLCNLVDSKDDPESRMVFSTYPTMMNAIDDAKRKDGEKLFTVGHFDLIIIDEAHRSIYKKYQAIFDYFDGILLGLTATPKDDIDKSTYSVFDLENNVPTYAYELDKAVKDKFLVSYNNSLGIKTKFLEEGIKYDELRDEDKEQYEETFDEDENIGDEISATAMNSWLFNDNTIDLMINTLIEKGIKVEGGDKIGKTIIFAKNHKHAEAIAKRFDIFYPKLKGKFARVIDHETNYAQSLIDDFSDKNKMPQIAISVDMMDTGIDVPEIVNLVFFKTVRSKSKFIQMIGRGTRLCKDLFGPGLDKENFLIFDFCKNFEFFNTNKKGVEAKIVASLTEKIFKTKVELIKELQHMDYQTEEYIKFRNKLVIEVLKDINSLDDRNFRSKQHLKYVHKFKNKDLWASLGSMDIIELKEHIAPLIISSEENEMTKRFDYLMMCIELSEIMKTNSNSLKSKVVKTGEELLKKGTVPEVIEKKDVIKEVVKEEFWVQPSTFDLERVREALRDLIRLIDKKKTKPYYTDFKDEIIEIVEIESAIFKNNLENYKKKVSKYLNDHKDEIVIYKLRNNKNLTMQDMKLLEKLLWHELGSKEDYEKEYGKLPMTRMIRSIVGLDRSVANKAFSQFLGDNSLNSNQIHFVELIVDYVVKNGFIEKTVLREDPFRFVGRISELFEDNMGTARKILKVIDDINNINVVGA